MEEVTVGWNHCTRGTFQGSKGKAAQPPEIHNSQVSRARQGRECSRSRRARNTHTHTIHVDIVTHACTYIHVNAGTHIHIQTHRNTTYTHTQTHAHTHTHTRTHRCTTRGFSVPPAVKGCVEVAQKIPSVSAIVSS